MKKLEQVESKFDKLTKMKQEAIRTQSSACDRKERYYMLMHRVTFSKKKLDRQLKITKRYQAAEKAEIEALNFIDRITAELNSLEQSSRNS